jgi:hypothetical protein
MTQTTILRAGIAGLALTACLAASPVLAETVTLKANLAAASEVPPNDSAATGNVTVNFDTASKKATWQGTYTGLSGAATAGHFHGPAEPGKNAGVAVPITASSSPFQGSADLTASGTSTSTPKPTRAAKFAASSPSDKGEMISTR